jgi:Ni,Fe-hydrogenase III large subunit
MPSQTAVLRSALPLGNGQAARLAEVPVLEFCDFRDLVLSGVEAGGRVSALFARRGRDGGARLTVVLGLGGEGVLGVASAPVGPTFPSMTPEVPQVHLFEREVAEGGLTAPVGHPWLKPVRKLPGAGGVPFFRVEGEEVHEVAVGPVHAGVIEPGHFRFQAHGETVHHLEIALGYQHRGVERAMVGGPDARTALIAETLSGDSSVAHATAYARALEALAHSTNSPRARALRGVALELERMANHTGDLGALAGDIGFLPTASYAGRVRGDFLNLTTALTGSRMGRGFVVPGGTHDDVDDRLGQELQEGTRLALGAAREAADLLWQSASARARFDGIGTLTRHDCEQLGIVGPAARASGLPRDVRREFPWGVFLDRAIEARLWPTGDVYARARLRWMEVEQSAGWVDALLSKLPPGAPRHPHGPLSPDAIAVSLVEGWRGEICHVAETDGDGRFSGYKVVDPSFHNWMGLALAVRGAAISDFPLINKSFNLSYAGHDL